MDTTYLVKRIRAYDSTAFRELESLVATDLRGYEEVIWTFVEDVDCNSCTDLPPQVLSSLYNSLGTDHVNKSIFAKWSTMSEVGKRNVCYGAGIPAALATELAYCLFFSPFSTVKERHIIAAGLALSAQERGIQKAVLWLLPQIGAYSSISEQEVLQQFVGDAIRSLDEENKKRTP